MKKKKLIQKQKMYKSNTNLNTGSEMGNVIKTVLIVGVLFGGMYLLTLYLLNKEGNQPITFDPPQSFIQYEKILAGNTFNKSHSEYIVMFYDFTDSEASVYNNLFRTFQQSDEDIAIYAVDLSDVFNQSFISDESNPNVDNIDNLKVNGPTLIQIVDGRVVEYLQGRDEITNKLS